MFPERDYERVVWTHRDIEIIKASLNKNGGGGDKEDCLQGKDLADSKS